MTSSRRPGRPPMHPSSVSLRMAKATARRKLAQGIFGFIFAVLELFVALQADFSCLALAAGSLSEVGVVGRNNAGVSCSDLAPLGSYDGTDACGGTSSNADASGGRSSYADASGATSSAATSSGATNAGATTAGATSSGATSAGGASLEETCPSFFLGTPFEDDTIMGDGVENRTNGRDVEDENGIAEVVNGRAGKKALRIGGITDLDPELVKRVNAPFVNPSETKDDWIRGRFDAWRLHVGKSVDKAIEEIPLDELADNLEEFMLCVRRLDGKCYPPDTLQNLYRGFNRILRRAQDARMIQNRTEEKLIDTYHDIKFIKARKALEVAMQESVAAGCIPKRKKSDIISREDQCRILGHEAHQVTNNLGLQKRFAFYCMSRFLIRGGVELRKVRDFQFAIGKDCVREYLEYCETTSKNWQGGINKCKPEDFREPIRCYEEDVIECWKHLEFRLPKYEVQDKFGGRFVFLQAINRPRSEIWYNTNHVSSKTIGTWFRDMAAICHLEGNYTNKSCRTTAITQMSVSGVPIEIGMKITGHKNPESYQRYDQSGIVAKASAMECLNSGKTYVESFAANVQTLNAGLSGNAEKAAGLRSSNSIPLKDVRNIAASSGSSSGVFAPVVIDDAYMSDLDHLLNEKPALKKYFNNENVFSSGGRVSITGNRIENFVINVGSLSEAGSLVKSLR